MTDMTPQRILEPVNTWGGMPPQQIGNALILAIPVGLLFGVLAAIGSAVLTLLILYGVHTNHPRALKAWLRTRPQGYRAGRYRRLPLEMH